MQRVFDSLTFTLFPSRSCYDNTPFPPIPPRYFLFLSVSPSSVSLFLSLWSKRWSRTVATLSSKQNSGVRLRFFRSQFPAKRFHPCFTCRRLRSRFHRLRPRSLRPIDPSLGKYSDDMSQKSHFTYFQIKLFPDAPLFSLL